MNSQQLETFLCASETLNLTETGKRLNFAQSSITAHIKKLEEELGYDLFERVGRRVVLTAQGVLFKDKASKLLVLMNEAKAVGKKQRLMNIGAQESQCIYRIPNILAEYKQGHPEVKMLFRPAHSNHEVEKEIVDGSIDIGFITDFRIDTTKLVCHELAREKIMLLCSPEHDLQNKKQITLSDLKDETFLFPELGCSYRTMFEQMLQKENIYLSNVTQFISIEAIKQCVKLNIGLAVLPELTVQEELNKEELVPIQLENELPMASTYLAYHKDKKLPNYLKSFVDLARKSVL